MSSRKVIIKRVLIALEVDVELTLEHVDEDRGPNGNGDREGWEFAGVKLADQKAVMAAIAKEIELANNKIEYETAIENLEPGASQ